MTPQQLELAVLEAIDRLRHGQQIEDDRIELKRDWPDPQSKARQLAGAANKANGDVLIYVVGADEKTGEVHPQSSTDTAKWWEQMSSRFDDISPDLVRHINVTVAPGESVTALLFSTDRAPYLVKVAGGGSPEREVPFREGTRTRSARRHELLRLLIPQSTVPPATLLAARLTADWYAANDNRPTSSAISGQVEIFLEHTAATSILLPSHESSASVTVEGSKFDLGIYYYQPSTKDAPPPPLFGVHTRPDGVVATGPGVFVCHIGFRSSDDLRPVLAGVGDLNLKLAFGVAGASRSVLVEAILSPDLSATPLVGEMQKRLGTWTSHS